MKLDILMHYEVNELTGEIKFIGKEDIKVDSGNKSSKKVIPELDTKEPKLYLNANNFTLNESACTLLNIKVGNTVHINYPKKDNKYVPVIGASEAFNVKSGNKLTKSLTVSFRGSANSKLAEYGTLFTLKPSEREGIFYLEGDKPIQETSNEEIEIDDDFNLDDLDDIDLDVSTDISTIDLTL